MFIESTKENLFSMDDVYESLILHCGLEYAESVMRLVNKDKEQRHLLLGWKYPEVRITIQSNK